MTIIYVTSVDIVVGRMLTVWVQRLPCRQQLSLLLIFVVRFTLISLSYIYVK